MNRPAWPVISVLVFFLVACAGNPSSATQAAPTDPDVVAVEIGYLNHTPVTSVLAQVDELLATYGERVSVTRYDFDTPEGGAFAQSKKLTEHTPLAIFVDGSMEFTLQGRPVRFYSFPQGQGTGVVPDGAWTLEDLQQVLDQVIEGN
jgi:hypothetical protein